MLESAPILGTLIDRTDAHSDVLFRFIVDMLVPVGGFHFVDAAPVPGRQ